MADDADTLLESAKCYACAEGKQLQLLILGLLKEILLASDPSAMTDSDTLLESAKCYACAEGKQLQLLTIALLAQIADNGGGGGGGGGVDCGAVDPVAPPTSTCGVYINTVTDRVWWYYNGAWN